jgi:hypothetical protein
MKIEKTKNISLHHDVLGVYSNLLHQNKSTTPSFKKLNSHAIVHPGEFDYLRLLHLTTADIVEVIAFELYDSEIYLGTFKKIKK